MSQKNRFITVILCVFLLSGMAGECFVDASAHFKKAENCELF